MVLEAAVFNSPDGDTIRFLLSASVTNLVSVQGRMLRSNGIIDPIDITFTHSAGDRTTEGFDVNPGSGTLLALNITIASTTKRGQAFIGAYMRRSGLLQQRLARGYVYDGGDVDLGDNEESLDGQGYLAESRSTTSQAEATFTVATNARWRIHSVWAENNAQTNQFVHVTITDGTNVLRRLRLEASPTTAGDQHLISTLNNLDTLPEGHEILVELVTFTAADSVEHVIEYEEWIEI